MAVAAARTCGDGVVRLGGIAVWSEIEIAHQAVDCRPVSACGWHVVRSARLLRAP
jgi:hypothetical protein